MTDDHMIVPDPTEEDAALMAALHRADPVVESTLPSPGDPTPQQLLEHIMNNEATSETNTESPIHPAVRDAARPRRRWGLMAAGAAAVLFLVAGVLAFAPTNTEPALAAVHNAAQATAEVNTGRITVTATAEGTDGTQAESLAGSVEAIFAGDDLSAVIDVQDAPSEAGFDQIPVDETRLVDGVIYLSDGAQWYSVEAPAILGDTLQNFVDPRQVLATVQELVEAEEIGTATIDGVETTHYRSIVDLQDESLGQAGWLALEGGDIDAEGEVQVDLFVDGEGLLRRLDVTGDVQEPDGGAGSATFEVSTVFTDLGADLSVEAPAEATPIDPLVESLFDE